MQFATLAGCILLLGLATTAIAQPRKISVIVTIAFICRFFLAWFQTNFRFFPYNWDEVGYHDLTIKMVEQWVSGRLDFMWGNYAQAYASISSIFYLLISTETYTMRVINAFGGALITLHVYKIIMVAFEDKRAAIRASFIHY